MIQKALCKRVVAAARRFEALAPWQEFSDQDVVAFAAPGEALPVFASVLGAGGQEFGLALHLGERALEQLRVLQAGQQPRHVAPSLLVSFDPPGAVPEELRAVAIAAGVSDRVIPTFWRFGPGEPPRPMRARELRLVAQVLEAFVLANGQDLLIARPLDTDRGGKVPTLLVESDGEGGKVRGVRAGWTTVPPRARATVETGAGRGLPWPLGQLPLVDAHWIVGLERAPFTVQGDTEPPQMLALVEAPGGRIRGFDLVAPDDDDGDEGEAAVGADHLEPAVRALASLLARPKDADGALPRQLTFADRRLFERLAPGLDERGVATELVPDHPLMHEALDALAHHFGAAEAAEADAAGTAGAEAAATVPGTMDVAAWARHNDRLRRRIEAALVEVDTFSRKALAAFYGEAEVAEALEELGSKAQVDAFCEWYLVGYRGKRGRQTIAERLLAQGLPEPERLLLEARVRARTGIYRVAEIRPPMLVLSDALSDDVVEIMDGAMAATLLVEALLPIRVADAAGYRFVLPLGPMLHPIRAERALAWLDEQWGGLRSEDLQRHPERLGRLWFWAMQELADEAAAPPRMTNTDGDPLRVQVATFRVADWRAFEGAVGARADVHDDGEPDRWVFVREAGGAGGSGASGGSGGSGGAADEPDEGNTILAHLERVGDELLVHVNSDARLAGVRAWLVPIPGVTFVGTREQDPTEFAGSPHQRRRGPAVLPEDLPPEALASLQRQIDAQCMRWLDEPIPALGGRTPREVVKTPHGRDQVLRLIRTWPDPHGIPGATVPRSRMRRDLGLDPGEGGGTAAGQGEGEGP